MFICKLDIIEGFKQWVIVSKFKGFFFYSGITFIKTETDYKIKSLSFKILKHIGQL